MHTLSSTAVYSSCYMLAHVTKALPHATSMHSRALTVHVQMECNICYEAVLLKEQPSGRCFGLLDCDHCFCLTCIRNWRDNSDADVDTATRTCPVCRRRTHFVTPSTSWPDSEVSPHPAGSIRVYSPCHNASLAPINFPSYSSFRHTVQVCCLTEPFVLLGTVRGLQCSIEELCTF